MYFSCCNVYKWCEGERHLRNFLREGRIGGSAGEHGGCRGVWLWGWVGGGLGLSVHLCWVVLMD